MWNDLLQTGRAAWRQWPTTTILVVLMGTGVACATSMFSVIDGVLFKPLPYRDAGELVVVGSRDARTAGSLPMTTRGIARLSETGLLPIAAYSPNLRKGAADGGDLEVAAVSPEFFEVLGVRPRIGRVLDSGDEQQAIVLSYSTWAARFAKAPTVLETTVQWSGRSYRIVGVLPDGVQLPAGAQAWIVLPKPAGPEPMAALRAIGRLPRGRSLSEVSAQLPDYALMPLREYVRPGGTFALVMLLIATCLVLGVAWIQVAAMQFSRAVQRAHEQHVRVALGASTWHLVRHGLAEGFWLSVGVLVTAAALTNAVTYLIVAQLPPQLTRGQPIVADVRVLCFSVAASAVGVLAFGLAPLWRRTPAVETLRGTSHRFGGTRGRVWLMTGQVTVAVPLIYLAGLAALSSARLSRVDLGFDVDGLYAVRLPPADLLNRERFDAILAERRATFRELAAVPGVVSVAAGGDLPFGGRTFMPLALSAATREQPVQTILKDVDGPYFETLGIPLHAGRRFASHDGRGADRVVMVDDVLAARLRELGRDVGARVLLGGFPAEVVGVVGNTRDNVHPSRPPEPHVYVPATQWIPPSYMFVRLADDASAVRVRAVLDRTWSSGPHDLTSVQTLVGSASADYRGRSTLLLLLAGCAAALTALGILGAVSAATRMRTGEIAIRIICGADPSAIATRVVLSSVGAVLVGTGAGLLLGLICARLTGSLLFATDPLELPLVMTVAALLLVSSCLAALPPALRAARIQPAEALRQD